MPNEDLIREIAARACRDALQEKSQELAADIASKMGAAIASQLEGPPRQLAEELRERTQELHALEEQTEALRASYAELGERSAEAHSLGAELRMRIEELRAREHESAELTEQLRTRDEELRERTQALNALEEQTEALRTSCAELVKRIEEAHSLDAELRQRTEELRAKERESAELTEQLRARDDELRERTQELHALEEQTEALRTSSAELGEHTVDAQSLDAELRTGTEELRAREHELGEITEQLRARDEDLRLRAEESTARENEFRLRTEEMEERIKELARVASGLRESVVLIASSRTQTETLEALLAAAAEIVPECGLLILRGSQAGGWSCRGLGALDNFKRATMDCSRGIAATVINSRNAMVTKVSELDPVFVARLGLEGPAEALLLPVLLKERVAALLLGLPKQGGGITGLELLVQVAQMALDLHSYRKAATQAIVEPVREVRHPHTTEPPRPAPTPQGPEPVYTPTLSNRVETVATAPQPQPEPVYAAAAVAPQTQTTQVATTASRQGMAAPQPAVDQAHEKARRFAKLLVEEIKLYNQTKVAEGRAHSDLYGRLRDDIEKSRAAYDKRYGESVRDVDYFTQELVRILADNNRGAMGAGFPS